MIKLILIILILLVIAVVRIILSVVRTVSNELPFWTEAAGKILNEFSKAGNNDSPNQERTVNLKHRPDFPERIDEQMAVFGKFIDENCKTNLYTFQFLEFCVSIHMAKADGVIDASEIDGIRAYFKETYGDNLNDSLLAKASPIIRECIQNYQSDELILSACLSLEVWFEVLKDTGLEEETNTELTFQIFSLVYQVALMDGVLAPSEIRFFQGICEFFEFKTETKEYIERMGEYQFNARKNRSETINREEKEIENALKLFQLDKTYSKEELHKAWKAYAKQNHPDKFHNVDKDLYQKMNDQFLEAKKGYELLLAQIEAKPESTYYEPTPAPEPPKEEAKPEEVYTHYAKEEPKPFSNAQSTPAQETTVIHSEEEDNTGFTEFLNESFGGVKRFFAAHFSFGNLKAIFWGTMTRRVISVGVPTLLLLANFLVPMIIESHYKNLLLSERREDYLKAYRYFRVQEYSSQDILKDVFRQSSNPIEKTNALHLLIELGDTSSEISSFILEMLNAENRIARLNLENIASSRIREEAVHNAILDLLKRKDTILREQVVDILSRRGIPSFPTNEANLNIFLGCKDDNSSKVALFCWKSLKPYFKKDSVRDLFLNNMTHISPDVQSLVKDSFRDELQSPEALDTLLADNKKLPETKKILDSLGLSDSELFSLLDKNPKYLRSNLQMYFKFLNKMSESELSGYLQSLNETRLKEQSMQNFIRQYAVRASSEFKEAYLPVAETPTPSLADDGSPQYAMVNDTSGLFLRDACSLGSDKLTLIPYKDRVEVISKDREERIAGIRSNWYRVRYNGQTGCSFGGYLEF